MKRESFHYRFRKSFTTCHKQFWKVSAYITKIKHISAGFEEWILEYNVPLCVEVVYLGYSSVPEHLFGKQRDNKIEILQTFPPLATYLPLCLRTSEHARNLFILPGSQLTSNNNSHSVVRCDTGSWGLLWFTHSAETCAKHTRDGTVFRGLSRVSPPFIHGLILLRVYACV